ncbi:MAG: hypothetical protein HRT38_18240 [Alteromonadaceae bacterium]|nr:hypothetical protein [Alteromonadaceae bacterium]
MKQEQPQWQPISMLPVFSEMIDGMSNTSIEQLETLYPVLDKPHILDDDTINRLINLYTEELNNQWIFEEQFRRWKDKNISPNEEQEVNRLIGQLPKLKTNSEKILKLVRSIEHNTIDKIIAMDEIELVDSIISGKIKPSHENSIIQQLKPEHVRLAERIHKKVTRILKHDGDELEILTDLTSFMPKFKALMDSTSEAEMDLLCRRYSGFHKYVQILENLAAGISSGEIPVP